MMAPFNRLFHMIPSHEPLISEKGSVDEESNSNSRRKSGVSIFWTLLTQLLGFLWLAPIITLLVLNFSSYQIGPSAWCFRGRCSADIFGDDAIGKAKRLDKDDHNTLGALQFVSKALELWFGFVAANLIFNLAMWLANRNDGLPIGLLSASAEFADPRSLFDTFRAAKRNQLQRNYSAQSSSKLPIRLFIACLIFLCLLVNLMGPATAVLVLPTLQWIDTEHHAEHTFRNLNLSSGPAGDNLFPECTDGQLSRGVYSCNSNSYAASLDSWVDLTVAGVSQDPPVISNEIPLFGISLEGEVAFAFNATDGPLDVAWAPNRQVLRELSNDLYDFMFTYQVGAERSRNFTNGKYEPYINSLQTILKRQGPVLGAYGGPYFPNQFLTVQVDPDRSLRCYDNYTLTLDNDDNLPQYTKCIRVGTGWTPINTQANFAISGSKQQETVHVKVFFSDKAAYYNSTYNPGLIPPACLVNRSTAASECPWGTVFEERYIPPNLAPVSTNILTIEITMPGEVSKNAFVYEFLTLAGYNATYTLDTSPSSNPLSFVQVDDIPTPKNLLPKTEIVDPNWLLAAWSVDQNGVLAQNRSAAIGLVRGFKAFFSNTTFNDTSLDADSTASNSSLTNGTSAGATSQAGSTQSADITSMAIVQRRASVATTTAVSSSAPIQTPAAATTLKVSAPNTVAAAYATEMTSYTTTTSSSSPSALPTTMLTPDSDEENEVPVDYFDFYEDDPSDKNFVAVIEFLQLSYLQALSMVDYSKDNITSFNKTTVDATRPQLNYYATIHVWMYGIDSRTSYLGVVVAIAGIVCVICSTILGLVTRRKERSVTDIIIAAIQHQAPQAELANIDEDSEHAARLRYRIQDDGMDEKIRFQYVK